MLDDALPVVVDLADADLAADVAAHVESALGWQVVVPSPHLPARVALADAVDPAVPTIVIVGGGAPRPAVEGALAVLSWPDDAAHLEGLVPAPVHRRPADRVLAVAGVAPRTGTSTIALAVGALHAWAGRSTVVVTDERGRRLAGVDGPRRQDVIGVAGLAVAGDVVHAAVGGQPDVLIVDRGVDGRAQVRTARPDADLITAAGRLEPAAVVVTTGAGGLHRAELTGVLGGRRHVALPDSFRVARAGVRGRVPVALPGAYLSALQPLVAEEVRAA